HLDAGAIAVLRSDDLDADGQTGLGTPRRRHGARQVRHARIARPEQLIGGGHTPTVDLDGALVALTHVVMREGGGGCGGAPKNAAHLKRILRRASLAASQSRCELVMPRSIRA